MKKRILSILLTVAMLVAMVPAIAVSASTTDTYVSEGNGVYRVDSIAAVDKFLSDKTVNITGNTMKLGADLDYSNETVGSGTYENGFWVIGQNYLQANVDGNGHTVTIPGGTYKSSILTYLTGSSYTFSNLKVKMSSEDAVAKSNKEIGLFAYTTSGCPVGKLEVSNCYFDVKYELAADTEDSGVGVLLGKHTYNKTNLILDITVNNCYFKMRAKVPNGSHGAIVGRTNSAAKGLTLNVSNSVFDVAYTKPETEPSTLSCSTVLGNFLSTMSVTKSENNLTYSNYKLADNGSGDTALAIGFTKVTKGTNPVTTVKGYQTTTIANNKFNLRLVGLVELGETALTDYSKVGFVVVANYANTTTKWTSAASNKVYSSITANTATETQALSATQLGGDHIYALAIKNIPSNAGDITFEVTPYYVAADGTTTVYGATTAFTVDVEALPTDTVNPTA